MSKKIKFTEQAAEIAHLINVQQDPDRNRENQEHKMDLLASRLRSGDRAAAAELVDLYYQQIYLYMRRLGHNHQVSEDLTQESFFQAWHHIGQLHDGEALKSWLYQIAGNTSRLYWRRHKDKKAISIEGFDVPVSSSSNRDKTEDDEQMERLESAIARLPIKMKQAVVLHYLQKLTIAEAAEAAGVRKGTLKSRLSRALEVLRKDVT
jgi:RNA polymerase sigma-70 factor (ECF subfamily)